MLLREIFNKRAALIVVNLFKIQNFLSLSYSYLKVGSDLRLLKFQFYPAYESVSTRKFKTVVLQRFN